MKRRLYTVLAIILTISCQVQELVEEQDSILTFYATGESGTRTTLSDPDWYWGLSAGRTVLWSPSDEINIYCQNGGGKFVSTNTEAASGTVAFVGTLEGVKDRSANDLYWAVYPYSEDNTFDGNSIGVSLKSEQQAVLGNVEKGLMISLARSGNNNLYFRNLCGIITIPVYERDIKKIVFKSNNGEPLAGKVKVSFDESGCPVVTEWKEMVSEITLLPPDGGTFEADKMYNVVCIPGHFEKGYTIEFYRDELVSIKQIHTPVTLSRAKFVNMTDLYTGGTIYSVDYGGKTYSLNYAFEEDSSRFWVNIDEKVIEIPQRFKTWPTENPTRMGPAVAINTDTETIYFAMANAEPSNYGYNGSTIDFYNYTGGTVYRITSSGFERTKLNVRSYPFFRLNEARHNLELHSYQDYRTSVLYSDFIHSAHSVQEKYSFNHWEPVNTSDDDIDYSSLGYNAKTLSDVVLLYQEEIKDYPMEMATVDLGLSVKWGSCNLGAQNPMQYGDQYAWGEITAKDSFTPENYKFGGAHSNPNSYWDYLGCIKYNDKDEKYFLDSEDDAAHVKLGEDWRIPSPEEWQELIENCVWKWTSFHDAVGVVGTSKINGKCIFFPADSSFRNGSLESGIYHSSQVVASNNHEFAGYYYNDYGQSIDVSFPSPTEDILGFFSQLRYDGAAIRPVYGHIAVDDVQLDETKVDLRPGESIRLTETISPSNATNMNVVWASSDESVATVSQEGEVRCVAEGKAVITVTTQEGGKTASCVVNRNYCAPPEIVDLGLSVKWASFNLGAKSPEEIGNYYSWGETKTKDRFYYATYKWCANESLNNLTKYCYDPDQGFNGFTDNKKVLDPTDDAAFVNLGGKWRMPTSQEIEELSENCEFTPAILNNVEGRWVTSRINGNRVFFPLSGFISDDMIYNSDCGYYWSSSLYTYEIFPTSAVSMMLSPETWGLWDSFRADGLPIRPVYDSGGNEGITPGDDINM